MIFNLVSMDRTSENYILGVLQTYLVFENKSIIWSQDQSIYSETEFVFLFVGYLNDGQGVKSPKLWNYHI